MNALPRKIGLALGSGGLRGIAHIGVLSVLEKEGVPIDMVAGCSIGSLIGALYCNGLLADDIYKLALAMGRKHWLDMTVPKMGLFAGERIVQILRILTQRKNFEELEIPLAVVATDLRLGKEVVFRTGAVAEAVRGSVSVPGIFVPYEYQGMLLVDGAVLNPTPINVARGMGAGIIIAVDLAHGGVADSVNNIFDVIVYSIDLMEQELFRCKQPKCDVMIRPDVAHISPTSFSSMEAAFQAGVQATEEAMPLIRRYL